MCSAASSQAICPRIWPPAALSWATARHAYIQTPDDDRHLSRLPKYFYIDEDIRINITRPGSMRQPSLPASFQAELSTPQSVPRSGPRPIRQRQRAAEALSRGACDAAPSSSPPASTQLQELEARVRSSRTPGTDRTGLGCTAATRTRPQGPSFHAARVTQPATPMDCCPPPGAQVLSPLAHRPGDMDVDVPPPAPARDSPMECDTAAADAGLMPPGCRVQTAAHPPADVAMDCDCPPLTHTDAPEPDVAQHGSSSPPPLELSGVASTRIEECFSYFAGHTDFSTAQARAAICALYARAPLLLQTADSAMVRNLTHEGLCHILRSLYGADSLPQDTYDSPPLTDTELTEIFTAEEPEAAPFQRQQLRPAIPPGFEERAEAIQAAQQATTGPKSVTTSGQSAARLDRWLISEHLRARVSADSQATGQVIGYPGDHLGVSLCLTAPRSTCYGAAAWRMPLHLLDDQPFCDRLTEKIPAYLTAHPLGLGLSRGRRWEDLKRHIKDIALQRSWALAAQRRASQTALETDSRSALTQYTSSPSAATPLEWLDAHHLLQALNAEAAKGAALQAGIVWQYYGEQSTFWFHHRAKERQSRTEIKALRTGGAPDSPPVLLDTPAGRNQGSTLLRDFYSGDSATGLFAARSVSLPAQAELLEALDKSLTPEAAATAEGSSGDGSIPITELEAALRSMPRGKAPGLDGIPYEFYQRFWPLVGGELTAVLQDAFTSPASPALPPSMLQGRIILLYKGKGADRASPASYRPITLLNTDYKLAARTVASRLGHVLNQVVDPTQTGFLPKRWVGDNVLVHLEEISYLQDTQQPGVIVFLDFEKTFDRLDRAWIEQCMAVMGFGAGAQRWVRILHTGTTARVAFNGWHTDAFPVSSGVFQGSPLSPLLFVLATQPMAAHARRRAQQQAFQPIKLPSGDPAPIMHQHADDTSIHAQSPSDAQVILDTTVDLHCAATGSKLQRSKSQGLGLGCFSHLEGPDAATGVTFVAQDASVKHLGVPLSRQPEAAATALYSVILRKVEIRIARWSGFSLSLLGRAYVAKQLLASMVTYHATFIPVPSQLEKRLCTALHTFVAANRPVLGGTSARLYPGKDTCFHAVKDGGIALVDLRAQILALQAKVVSRLLEPEQLAWKAFFDFWLYRTTAWQTAQEPRPAAHHQHIWQLGRFLPFSAFDAQRMQAPLRVRQYVYAYQKLQPHRLSQPDSLEYHEVMCEPLFFNRQVRDATGQPIALEAWARQGLVRVSDLRTLVHSPPPTVAALQSHIQLLLAALPEQWRMFVHGPPSAAQWLASPASSSGALVPVPAGSQQPLPATAQPVLVLGWNITRPWHPRHSTPRTQEE
ncbi:probable LINE-1 retrotransposable element ORF2 protein [Coccomyxa sp. Obi]|nr:probable LINE-1 retrotransposable element ORF2 protein [Coccomyxa sp. Obi]